MWSRIWQSLDFSFAFSYIHINVHVFMMEIIQEQI